MTTILKFPIKHKNNVFHDGDKLPNEVVEWMVDHPECKIPELNFHYGYHVFIFHDDISATEFKLRFKQIFDDGEYTRK